MRTVTEVHGKPVTVPGPWSSIEEIREANVSLGQFFFSSETMRFFRSRLGKKVVAGRFFITSERFMDSWGRLGLRRYTLRVALDNGRCETVGGFQAYRSSREAYRAAERLASS
jgi:hypothetical protein